MNHPPMQASSDAATAPCKRKSRAKKFIAWEQIELASGGFYTSNLLHIARHFPVGFTKMELRIAALARAMLPSREIADRLGISEETVENHRVNIRRKLGLGKENLVEVL